MNICMKDLKWMNRDAVVDEPIALGPPPFMRQFVIDPFFDNLGSLLVESAHVRFKRRKSETRYG